MGVPMLFFNLLYNVSLLFVLIYLLSLFKKIIKEYTFLNILIQGAFIGLVTIIGMKYSIVLESGLIFDGRSIIISLATLFYGPIVGFIGSLIGAIFRINIGGSGWLPGTLTFFASFIAGSIFYYLKTKNEKKWTSGLALVVLGYLTHILVLLCMLLLPKDLMIKTYKTVAPIMLTLYPLFTWLIGKLQISIEETEKLHEELARKESKFRTALYSIGDGVVTTDCDGKIVTMNQIAEQITGWKEEEVRGMPIYKIFTLINEETRLPVPNPVDKVLREGMVIGLANHTLLINRNGKEIPIADSASPIRNDNGEIVGVVFVFRDQTAEKNYLDMLVKGNKELKKAEEIGKLGYWTRDIKKNKYNGSEGALKIFELDKPEISVDELFSILPKESQQTVFKSFSSLVSGQIKVSNIDFEIITFKTKQRKFLRSISEYDPVKEVIFGVVQDITEQKLAEQKIRESEEKLRLIIENQNEFVVKLNLSYEIDFANISAINFFQLNDQKLNQTKIIDLIHQEDFPKLEKSLNSLINRQNSSVSISLRVLRQNTIHWIDWQFNSISDEQNNLISIVAIGRDVTESKIINETLEFLGNISSNLHYYSFFNEYLKFLNQHFPSDILIVGKIKDNKSIETLSVIKNNEFVENFTITLKNKHCYEIFNEQDCFGEKLCEELISEPIFAENNIKFYSGTTLYNLEQKPIGIILLMKTEVGNNNKLLNKILSISSSRCSSEIEKEQIERNLQEQARLYKTLVENLPGFVYRCKNDRDWTMEFISAQCEEITGYKPEEFINNNVLPFNDIIKPEYQDYLWNKWQKCLANREIFEDEYTIITKSGEEKIVWERGQGIFDENGQLICIEGFIYDITDRKIKETQLREISNRMQVLYSNMVQGVVFIDKNEQITFANPAAEKILGLTIDQMNGRTPHDPRWKAIHEDGRNYPAHTHPSLIALHTGGSVHNAIMGVFNPIDNKHHWLNVNAIPQKDEITGEVKEVFVTFEDITESFYIRQQLKENEEKYRSLVTQMQLGLAVHQAVFDENGKMIDYIFLDINDSYERMVGIGKNAIGKSVRQIIPEIEEYWIEIYEKVVKTGEAIHFENFASSLNKHFEVVAYRNMPNQFAVIVNDVTEKVRSRYELEELYSILKNSEERFRLAMEASSDGIWDWNILTDEVYYSPAYYKMLGYEENEIEFNVNTWLNLLHPEDKDDAVKVNMNCVNGLIDTFAVEFRMRCKNGDYIWVLSRSKVVQRDENGKAIRLIGTHTNINDRKLYEDELLRTKETYQNIFDSVQEAIFVMNYNYEFIDINQSAEKIFDCEKSKLIGKTPEFISASNKNDLKTLTKTLERVKQIGGVAQFEFWGQRSNGQIFPMEIIVARGKYFGQDVLIATARDISTQKELIEELTKAKEAAEESDALKSAFLANMSHEIRTPMNAIIGFSQFLEDDDITPEEKKEYLTIINQKGKDLLQLIDDILDLSKIESGQLTLFLSNGDLTSVIYEVVNTFRTQDKLIEYHYDKKLEIRIGLLNPLHLECNTDFYRLKQILNNLISNAIKFTDEGYVEVGYELIDDEIQFYVKDTGIGIHPKNITKIFDRFRQGDEQYQTRKYGGTGLGLSICKGLVAALEGNIWVESEFGKGSTFYFTIKYYPVNEKQNHLIEQTKISKVMNTKTIKVLIAEDEYSNFQLLRRVLEKNYNVEIIYAKNGIEAVEFCEANPDLDIIFMDIRMPLKSGIEAFKEIRAMGCKVPVVAITAYALVEERARIQSAGFDGYISKPFKKEDVFNLLNLLGY